MREIKFRAWDGKDMIMNPLLFPETYKRNELMQYICIKDKKGMEIYEGDILQNGDWVGRVVYEAPEYKFNDGKSSFSISFEDFEVIGNIYENPELLK